MGVLCLLFKKVIKKNENHSILNIWIQIFLMALKASETTNAD